MRAIFQIFTISWPDRMYINAINFPQNIIRSVRSLRFLIDLIKNIFGLIPIVINAYR